MSEVEERYPPQGFQLDTEHYYRYLKDFCWSTLLRNTIIETGWLSAVSFQVPVRLTVEAIGCVIGDIDPGTNIRMGIYEDNGDDPRGGALLVQGEMAVVADQKNEVAIALTQLDPGLYWFAYHPEGDNAYYSPPWRVHRGGTIFGWSFDLVVYGALPNPFPVGAAAQASLPAMYVLVASVP